MGAGLLVQARSLRRANSSGQARIGDARGSSWFGMPADLAHELIQQ